MLPDAPDDGTARPGFPVSAAVLLPDFPVPAIDAALPGVPASADAPPAAPSSDEGAAWPGVPVSTAAAQGSYTLKRAQAPDLHVE